MMLAILAHNIPEKLAVANPLDIDPVPRWAGDFCSWQVNIAGGKLRERLQTLEGYTRDLLANSGLLVCQRMMKNKCETNSHEISIPLGAPCPSMHQLEQVVQSGK